MRIGIVTDTHIGSPDPESGRQGERALEFLREVFFDFRDRLKPDLVLHLGDIVDDGTSLGREGHLDEFVEVSRILKCPLAAIPGNHDAPADPVRQRFGPYPRRLDLNGHSVLFFDDAFAEDDSTSRSEADLRWLRKTAGSLPSFVISVQHAPLFPVIEGDYPFNLTNRDEIHEAYKEAGVCLSLSGHYHRGLEPMEHDGVVYAVAPTLCEEPHPYVVLDINDGNIDWRVINLR